MLGTATVALAVPIYKGLAALRGRILPLFAALLGTWLLKEKFGLQRINKLTPGGRGRRRIRARA